MDIEALYFEALLAQAAYADGLEPDMTAIELTEKLMAVPGMTTVQGAQKGSGLSFCLLVNQN